ncbi:speckle-type POZ protein A-like [Copidosoma floridanum]|uniref:speckle-type POZ protein A-like n=1 Tax=Copidosoma floridanum TaxID=29053 RepID=UPI0006C9698B|nr:speckle-type POZ protein A-like [Copidosoma floridanum]
MYPQGKIKRSKIGCIEYLSQLWKVWSFGKFIPKNQVHHFQDPNNDNIWSLEFSNDTDNTLTISLTLSTSMVSKSEASGTRYFYELTIFDTKMKELCKKESSWNFSMGTSKDWHINETQLILNSLQSDGSLFVQCNISTDNIFVSRDHSFQSELCWNFTLFLKNQTLTDVTIITNNEKLRAHKIVLACRSPVFLAMFDNDMLESRNNVVEIKDFDSSVIIEMLRYMYTGEVENINDIADDLVRCADKYLISELKESCETYLANSLTLDNVLSRLCFANFHNCNDLKNKVCRFFATHKQEIIDHPNFKELSEEQPSLIIDLFCNMVPEKLS